jgi:bacillithiol system protein YtxJ
MNWFKKSSTKPAFNWIDLTSESQFLQLWENQQPFAIFKHSTRCSISSMAKSRIEREWNLEEQLPLYYLDLIQHRNITNLIADKTNVVHQSPQLIVVSAGKVIYHASHNSIDVEQVREKILNSNK